jgi:hypothetical protein
MDAVSHCGDRSGAVDVRALLVSADPITIQRVGHVLKEFSISPAACQEMSEAVADDLLGFGHNERTFDFASCS